MQAQTYPNIEHVVVSDGPDPVLRASLGQSDQVRFLEMPEHDPLSRWGEYARICGDENATGDLLTHVDDDDELLPRHVEVLVDAIERSGADFAYSQMRINHSGRSEVIGQDPPIYGQIGVSFLYRRSLLDLGTWRIGYPSIDWDLIERWMAVGARWVYVPEVTIECYPSTCR
jgi:glycosyltransferase involved in cell wall biosynthesis